MYISTCVPLLLIDHDQTVQMLLCVPISYNFKFKHVAYMQTQHEDETKSDIGRIFHKKIRLDFAFKLSSWETIYIMSIQNICFHEKIRKLLL